MYQYYTLEECSQIRAELRVPWKYIEECVGIKRTTLGHYKKVVRDPDAIKRASILYTVAIRSYIESGVATAEEKRLFESYESAKKEVTDFGHSRDRYVDKCLHYWDMAKEGMKNE